MRLLVMAAWAAEIDWSSTLDKQVDVPTADVPVGSTLDACGGTVTGVAVGTDTRFTLSCGLAPTIVELSFDVSGTAKKVKVKAPTQKGKVKVKDHKADLPGGKQDGWLVRNDTWEATKVSSSVMGTWSLDGAKDGQFLVVGNESWMVEQVSPDDDEGLTFNQFCGQAYEDSQAGPDPRGFICVDTATGRVWSPTPSVLRPNTGVDVAVQYPKGHQLSVTATGTRGLALPTWMDNTGIAQLSEGGDETEAPEQAIRRLGARQPGTMDVTVELTKDGKSVYKHVVAELDIDQAYAGSVRLGAGLTWSPNQRDWQVVTAPGSAQPELQSARIGQTASAEMVLGFAAYLNRGGRSYIAAPPEGYQRIAPYVGLGLLGTSTDADQPLVRLGSLYAGLEYELNPQSSITAAAVWHRTGDLADGYTVGGPVPAGVTTDTLPLKYGYVPGFAVVLNFSPAFLNVARSSSNLLTASPS